MILPGQTIGVLGGGQLGRMIILEGRKMGYRFVTLDPTPDAPGAQVSDQHIKASFDDLAAADQLAELSDLIIYEFENIDPKLVQRLEAQKPVPQGSYLLSITRDRLQEKAAIEQAGASVAPFAEVSNEAQLQLALENIGLPAVLKTTTGGYDGKGQWTFRTNSDVEAWLEKAVWNQTFIFEQFVPFLKEISVVVARNGSGEAVAFPPTVNIHRNHILHLSIAPATIAPETVTRAMEMAKKVAEHLHVVGLLAVEMFLQSDGSIYVNELAPRPHNSGHYTYDACNLSQFEQFLRAVLHLPLIKPSLNQSAIMINLLGEHKEKFFEQFPSLPSEIKIHWYGKHEAKVGRKMGHLTLLTNDVTQGLEQIEKLGLYPPLTSAEKDAVWGQEGVFA